MNIATDRRLILLAARGDQDAFGELVHHHQSSVFNIAYRMLGSHSDAEDVAQEVFIRAYRSFETFDTERPLMPWLKRITINVCLNRIKQNRPTPSVDDLRQQPEEPSPGPEAQTANREREAQVRTAILSLSPQYRAVIELRHFQDLSYSEISKVLDRPITSVKSDLFRARKILGEKLKEYITK